MDCLSVFSLFPTHPCIPNTHSQKSLCHSDFLHLQFFPVSSCLSLSVFSKNSINQKLPGFFTYGYLWSCCSYRFHAPDKCTEYSTQPRQEYFITGQMRRGSTCYLLKMASSFLFLLLHTLVVVNLHITHPPSQTHIRFTVR